MNQRVKLQVSTDLEDVPSFCAHSLTEVESRLEQLQSVVKDIKNVLNSVSFEDKDNLKKTIDAFNICRVLLMKVDGRLGDTASIVGGLAKLGEPQEEETVQAQEVSEEGSQQNVGL